MILHHARLARGRDAILAAVGGLGLVVAWAAQGQLRMGVVLGAVALGIALFASADGAAMEWLSAARLRRKAGVARRFERRADGLDSAADIFAVEVSGRESVPPDLTGVFAFPWKPVLWIALGMCLGVLLSAEFRGRMRPPPAATQPGASPDKGRTRFRFIDLPEGVVVRIHAPINGVVRGVGMSLVEVPRADTEVTVELRDATGVRTLRLRADHDQTVIAGPGHLRSLVQQDAGGGQGLPRMEGVPPL